MYGVVLFVIVGLIGVPAWAEDKPTCEAQLTQAKTELTLKQEYITRLNALRGQQEMTALSHESLIVALRQRIASLEKSTEEPKAKK